MDDNEAKVEDKLKMVEEVWNPQLLQACKKGDTEKLLEAIENGGDLW